MGIDVSGGRAASRTQGSDTQGSQRLRNCAHMSLWLVVECRNMWQRTAFSPSVVSNGVFLLAEVLRQTVRTVVFRRRTIVEHVTRRGDNICIQNFCQETSCKIVTLKTEEEVWGSTEVDVRCRGSQSVGRPPWGVAVGPLGARVDCTRDIFILNEIWVQDKIYILVEIFYLPLTTQYRYCLRTINNTFCRC
jgi:hypothetical protein